MSWLSVTANVFYYILFPVTTLLSWILLALAPFYHLGSSIFSWFFLPLRFLAKFETLYTYLGVAAVIGLVTGSLLHLSSAVLVSLFNLKSVPEANSRPAASVRTAREQKRLEEAWQSSSLSQQDPGRLRTDKPPHRNYMEWLDKDIGKRREDQGLFKQTILEEDDDSEEGF